MASRIIDVDYYAGGDRKVVTSVDVYKSMVEKHAWQVLC